MPGQYFVSRAVGIPATKGFGLVALGLLVCGVVQPLGAASQCGKPPARPAASGAQPGAKYDRPAPARKALPRPGAEQTLGYIQLTEAHKGKTIGATVGRAIIVRLPGDASTGCRWELTKLSGNAVNSTARPEYVAAAERRTGRLAGAYILKFLAVAPGRSTIRAAYNCPNDKGKPVNTFTVEVMVKKQE